MAINSMSLLAEHQLRLHGLVAGLLQVLERRVRLRRHEKRGGNGRKTEGKTRENGGKCLGNLGLLRFFCRFCGANFEEPRKSEGELERLEEVSLVGGFNPRSSFHFNETNC